MGQCCHSKPTEVVTFTESLSHPSAANGDSHVAIDQLAAGNKKFELEKIKLLLLGPGESGKSTIFKQMRILYGEPKSNDELRMYGVVVRSNIIVAIRKLCMLVRQLGLELKFREESQVTNGGMTRQQAYDEVISYLVDNHAMDPHPGTINQNDWVGHSNRVRPNINKEAQLFLQHVEAIRVLWESQDMKNVWKKRALENINDSHKDFLQDVTRISSPNYKPTDHDILICRIRTTQFTIERYMVNDLNFEVYDVGGQRGQRKQWIEVFEGVDAVIFVAALSEYDQNLSLNETNRVENRMIESLNLFQTVMQNRALKETSVLLFLNKKDIFEEKILYSDISAVAHFSDYNGPARDVDEGILYFIRKFQGRIIGDELGKAFIHVTCATDTTNMKFIFDSIGTIIMQSNIDDSYFFGTD